MVGKLIACVFGISLLHSTAGNGVGGKQSMGGEEFIVVGNRYRVSAATLTHRGAGEVDGHPMIKVVESNGEDDVGKFVGEAWDISSGQRVFLKCTPKQGGAGTVEGQQLWHGEEAEESVRKERHVISSFEVLHLSSGSSCRAYELAENTLSRSVWYVCLLLEFWVSDAFLLIHHAL